MYLYYKNQVRMKNTLIILSLIFLLGCNENPKEIKIPKNNWNQSINALKELNKVLNKEQGKTWNHSLRGALMLVNRENRIIIANESDNSGKFMKQGDYFVGKLPETINISNTAFDWDGKRWIMLALPLPKTKEEQLNYLIHESFHRIQPLIGFDSLYETQNIHLDSKRGRIYLKLELAALKQALNSKEPNIHIKNALLFRQYRHQIISEAKASENALELKEGLAEYTGSILSKRTDSNLIKHYISQIDQFYTVPSFVRSFAYFTIPVYGYFMQKKDKTWNLQIQATTNITDFMLEFWHLKAQKLTEKYISQIGKEYGIETIINKENQRETRRQKLKNKYQKKFLKDSTLVIRLENINIGFNPGNVIPLDSLGTVYPFLRITDNWGILKVDSGGALINSKWSEVTVSTPQLITDTLVLGKGWNLKLNKSRRVKLINNKYTVERISDNKL